MSIFSIIKLIILVIFVCVGTAYWLLSDDKLDRNYGVFILILTLLLRW